MSKRKYREGEHLTLIELVIAFGRNKGVYVRGKYQAAGWYGSQPMQYLAMLCREGLVRAANRIQEDDNAF